MLVSIALTATTLCMVRACTECLNEMQWPETRDKTYWAESETETYRSETRPEMHRSETRRDETLVRLETVSRPRRLNRDHIPGIFSR